MEKSKEFVTVLVDCTKPQEQQDAMKKYGVQGFPTILFTDPNGKKIGQLKERDAKSVVKQLDKILVRVNKGGKDEKKVDSPPEKE